MRSITLSCAIHILSLYDGSVFKAAWSSGWNLFGLHGSHVCGLERATINQIASMLVSFFFFTLTCTPMQRACLLEGGFIIIRRMDTIHPAERSNEGPGGVSN